MKDLCAHYDLSLNPSSIGKALVNTGVMREISYLSTTGSGEEKQFKEIVPDYLEFGVNRKTMHEFKTEPRFYIDKFPQLLEIAVKQIQLELDQVKGLNT
ncbi:hypothetical protein PL263_10445 [Methylomonas sp. EFPC3]|uniref:hypothetical protein n=1 Tax=Methylomonas sp. EFPC3 TaxID=3021710 RepID=UPI0024176E02|nr:hypothetical protein [Methylomonas sp. EFPC3]WFP48532.1 hypothetical protein PL263_10445 [Methylomonas sp. EFPC3]